MMEAMEREDRPVVKEECPVVESVTAPATPHNVLDRRNGLCCQRCVPGRCDQCRGVMRYQESSRKNYRRRDGSEGQFAHLCLLCCASLDCLSHVFALFVSCNRALETKAQREFRQLTGRMVCRSASTIGCENQFVADRSSRCKFLRNQLIGLRFAFFGT
jgi:hypothetical protein